jgi:hypothetical protein
MSTSTFLHGESLHAIGVDRYQMSATIHMTANTSIRVKKDLFIAVLTVYVHLGLHCQTYKGTLSFDRGTVSVTCAIRSEYASEIVEMCTVRNSIEKRDCTCVGAHSGRFPPLLYCTENEVKNTNTFW